MRNINIIRSYVPIAIELPTLRHNPAQLTSVPKPIHQVSEPVGVGNSIAMGTFPIIWEQAKNRNRVTKGAFPQCAMGDLQENGCVITRQATKAVSGIHTAHFS